MTTADFRVENHGTIIWITPMSRAALQWVEINVPDVETPWPGEGFAVDRHRFEDMAASIAEFAVEYTDWTSD